MFLFEDRFPLVLGCFKDSGANAPSSPGKTTLPSPLGTAVNCLATWRQHSQTRDAVPRVPGCGGCPAREDDVLERVTCWRGCRVQGWGWGAPRLLPPRHRGLCTSPAPLTWRRASRNPRGSAALIWVQTRCGGGGGRGSCVALAALRSPASLSQPGRGGRAASHVLRRDAGSVSPLGWEEGRQPSRALSPISRVSHEMSKLGGNADGQSQMP